MDCVPTGPEISCSCIQLRHRLVIIRIYRSCKCGATNGGFLVKIILLRFCVCYLNAGSVPSFGLDSFSTTSLAPNMSAHMPPMEMPPMEGPLSVKEPEISEV
jgi:hypothetical protein